MAIPTLYAPQYFTGNNSDSTAYTCSWKALDKTNLRVIATLDADGTESSVLSDGSGITVTLVGNTVEFTTTTAYDSTYTITAFLTSDYLQSNDLQNSGNNDVNVREEMFDKLTLMLQIALSSVSETAGIPISFPSSENTTTQTLPTAPNRLNSMIEFDANGDLTTIQKAVLFQQIADFLTSGQLTDIASNQVVSLALDKTLAASDGFRLWLVDASGGDITITLPQDSDATIAIGWKADFSLDSSSNNILFAAGSGATLNSNVGATPKVDTQFGGATVVKTAADEWQIFGRLTAQ